MLRSVSIAAFLLSVSPSARAEFLDHEAEVFAPSFAIPGESNGADVGFIDYDGDGDDDVVVAMGSSGVALYENGGEPDFSFTDVTVDAGLSGGAWVNVFAVGAADFDRDGDSDLFAADKGGIRLLRNEGDGSFVDVSDSAFPGDPWYAAAMAFVDLDGDGWTDVYVGNYTLRLVWPFHECSPSVVLHNRADGTFESVADAWGLVDDGCTLSVLASDADRDGDLDLLAANDFGMFVRPNTMFRNDGLASDGSVRLVDVSAATGFDQRLYGMGLATADVNADGWPDYFSTSIGRCVLLLGSEVGTFEDATEDYGVMSLYAGMAMRATWGAAFLDVSADGSPDLYVASGWLGAASEIANDGTQPNLLFDPLEPGHAGAPAEDVAISLGVAPSDSARGVAIADFDSDGDDDILTAALGGDVHLYRNDGARGPAARVRLHGTVSSPDAFGASLSLRCDGVQRFEEYRTDGSYGSAPGTDERVSLAGCGGGGTLGVRWPSGLEQDVALDGDDAAIDLVEPEFLTARPDWIPADGSSEATIRFTPLGPDAAPLGAGRAVGIDATAGTVGAVTDLGDGSYEATLVAPATPGDAAIRVSVDGVEMSAHPRVRFFEGDRTTIHLSPSAYVADETLVVVTVVPRDASGALDPPGRDVDLVLGRAVPVGAVVEAGDGRYVATVRGLGGGPLVVRADVDGTTRAQTQLDETSLVDPAKSVARLQPGWVDAADLAAAETVVELSPRDGRGALTPDVEGLTVRLLDPSDVEIPIGARMDRDIGIFLTLPAQRLADEGPARIEVDGVVLDRVLEMSTWSDADELRAAIDPARSHAAPYHQTAYADGEDYSDLAIELRDSDGDLVPLGPLVDYESDQMTLVSAETSHEGLQATVRMRTGLVDGPATVDVLVDGEPTGVQGRIDLLPAIDHDTGAIDVEMCLGETETPADGVGRIRAEIRPRWEDDGTLVGSNVPLTLSADGVEIPLDYVKPSTYEGWIDVPAEAGTTTVTVSMPGTADTADLWIEFYVLGEYEDHGLPSCTSTGDPAEDPDAGPDDAGPDAGPDGGDADGDADVDTDSDADADPDGGAPADGAPHFDPRGGGCACSAAGL